MGVRNTSGIPLQCSHCGYTWLYTGDKDVTSCPHCGWRVRVRPARRVNIPANSFSSYRDRELI